MDEKQRRLIGFFNHLPTPQPPRPTTSDAEAVFEFFVPGATAPPAKPTPDSVRAMLARRQLGAADDVAFEARARAAVPETVVARATTDNLLRPPVALDLPVTERVLDVAASATEKAIVEAEMTPEEAEIFEALVLPGLRPVIDIVDGDMGPLPPTWEWLEEFRSLIQGMLPSIGRIDLPELSPPLPYGGTGFFVGDGLLMTNRHVARLFVEGAGQGRRFLRFLPGLQAFFDSQYEVGDTSPVDGGERYEITEAVIVHPHWDMALLRVKALGEGRLPPALQLARNPPPLLGGGGTSRIIVIGYPARDERDPASLAQQDNIFRRIFGRKRLMPGTLPGTPDTFVDIRTKWNTVLNAVTHDASTLGGNSGSAVIDLDTGQVIALHFGGRYLQANYGVPMWELARDSRVVDEGVSFAGDPPAGPRMEPVWISTWKTAEPLQGVGTAEAGPEGEQPTPSVAEATQGKTAEVVTTAAGGGVPMPVVDTTGAGGQRPPSSTPVLPVAPDWFERVSDAELVEAMRRDLRMTERLIRETLLEDEADDLLADLRQAVAAQDGVTAEEGIFDFLTGGGTVDPTLPEIIFLHGIMGGHLATSGGLGGRVWLSPLALVAGGVARRLTLAGDGERENPPNQILSPDGHLRLVYEKAARKWRMRGFVVHAFAFDWRKPIANSADRLHLFVESLRLERPGKRFALVGHSMGGLVAALYAARHPEWSARVSQAIFLGSPLRGSFAPIEGLLGTYPVYDKVAFADTRDDLQHYVAMTRTLPGLIDMLPDPDIFPDAASLYERATWQEASAPAQIWLDQSRQVKRLLAASPILQTARLIVSTGHPTVGQVAIVGGQLRPGRRNQPGDGTVPIRSAAASVAGVTVFRASAAHGDLPREQAVITAVEDLLRNGTCSLPALTERAIENLGPIEEALAEAVAEPIEEAVSAGLAPRLSTGIFTQRDMDFLLRADETTRPGPVGQSIVPGGV